MAPLAGSIPLDQARAHLPSRAAPLQTVSLPGSWARHWPWGDGPYYGCYELHADGSVNRAAVIDGQGVRTLSSHILEVGGAWPWLGSVTSPLPLLLGGAGIAALIAFGFVYYRQLRPGPPVRRRAP